MKLVPMGSVLDSVQSAWLMLALHTEDLPVSVLSSALNFMSNEYAQGRLTAEAAATFRKVGNSLFLDKSVWDDTEEELSTGALAENFQQWVRDTIEDEISQKDLFTNEAIKKVDDLYSRYPTEDRATASFCMLAMGFRGLSNELVAKFYELLLKPALHQVCDSLVVFEATISRTQRSRQITLISE